MKINKNWLAVGAGVLVVAIVGLAAVLNQGNLFSGNLGGLSLPTDKTTPVLINTITKTPSVTCSGTPNPGHTGNVIGSGVTWTAQLYNIPTIPTFDWSIQKTSNSYYSATGNPVTTHYNAGVTESKATVTVSYWDPGKDPTTNLPHVLTPSCSVALNDLTMQQLPGFPAQQVQQQQQPPQQQIPNPLTAFCQVSETPIPAGFPVTWMATAEYGTAPYTYKWSGAGIDGQTTVHAVTTYSDADVGDQTGTLTVTDAKSATTVAQCSLTVQKQPLPNALTALCQVSQTPVPAGFPVTWMATAENGTAPYTYKWSGAGIDGQTGVHSVKTYSDADAGDQTATLTITDAKSATTSAQCSLTVQKPAQTQPAAPQQTVQPTKTTQTTTQTTQPVKTIQTTKTTNITSTTPSNSCAGFTDLSAQDPNCDAITFVKQIGAMTGTPNGNFDAEGLIQRDQIAKIALETFKLYDDQQSYCQGGVSGFPDVTLKDWSFQYACRAKALGVITGYLSGPDAGYFRPSRFLSRAEFLAIILRNLKESLPSGTSYTDVSVNDWFSAYARFSFNNNLYPGDTLFPEKSVTRREAAVILFKLHQLGKI